MSSQMLIFTMTTELLLKIHKSMLQLIPGKNISETCKSHSSKKKKERRRQRRSSGLCFCNNQNPQAPTAPCIFLSSNSLFCFLPEWLISQVYRLSRQFHNGSTDLGTTQCRCQLTREPTAWTDRRCTLGGGSDVLNIARRCQLKNLEIQGC